MAQILDMPQLSDTMREGVLRKWRKNEGEKMMPGETLAEVETDKATMDFEAFDEGWDPLESTCRHASLSIL